MKQKPIRKTKPKQKTKEVKQESLFLFHGFNSDTVDAILKKLSNNTKKQA